MIELPAPTAVDTDSITPLIDAVAARGYVVAREFIDTGVVAALRSRALELDAAGRFSTAAVGRGAEVVAAVGAQATADAISPSPSAHHPECGKQCTGTGKQEDGKADDDERIVVEAPCNEKRVVARVVLGEMDRAKAAYGKAREHFGAKPDALAALAATAKELKVE